MVVVGLAKGLADFQQQLNWHLIEEPPRVDVKPANMEPVLAEVADSDEVRLSKGEVSLRLILQHLIERGKGVLDKLVDLASRLEFRASNTFPMAQLYQGQKCCPTLKVSHVALADSSVAIALPVVEQGQGHVKPAFHSVSRQVGQLEHLAWLWP
ncbi:MAG TPA: hypothetical protein V6D20_23655 [Candidatus Obscuribacterales bacterium]